MTTHKMNPEIKAKWLAALRSGEYTQTTGTLKRVIDIPATGMFPNKPVGLCCLGVLCDLYAKETGIDRWTPRGGFAFNGDVETDEPPRGVSDWAGLEERNPVVYPDTPNSTLAELNDRGKTFLEIADIIEKEL